MDLTKSSACLAWFVQTSKAPSREKDDDAKDSEKDKDDDAAKQTSKKKAGATKPASPKKPAEKKAAAAAETVDGPDGAAPKPKESKEAKKNAVPQITHKIIYSEFNQKFYVEKQTFIVSRQCLQHCTGSVGS